MWCCMLDQRVLLLRLFKYFSVAILIVVIAVLVDFSIDIRPSTIQSSYRFTIRDISYDQPQRLQQDNLSILLIKRSEATIKKLQLGDEGLQDLLSNESQQPNFAQPPLRSRYPEFFVSYGNGTDLGCIVEQKSELVLAEVCGTAEYDFAGRALNSKKQFQNLSIPDYNFSDDFKILTIRP